MNIKLDMFEGPLDLLLHLIEKAEVDIYEIPIAHITKQYMEVLTHAEELKLEVASEFIVMAATLLSIKSRMLLPPSPKSEEGIEETVWQDPRQELVEKLLEYKQYKAISELLHEKEEMRKQIYSRLPMRFAPPSIEKQPIVVQSAKVLLHALDLMLKSKETAYPIQHVGREEIPISKCIEEIYLRLQRGAFSFFQLFSLEKDTSEKKVTFFLALLELIKQQRVICKQLHLFEDILIIPASQLKRVGVK